MWHAVSTSVIPQIAAVNSQLPKVTVTTSPAIARTHKRVRAVWMPHSGLVSALLSARALWDGWIAFLFMPSVFMVLVFFFFCSHFKTWTKSPPTRQFIYVYEQQRHSMTPDSYELSVTMARGKPHPLWYRHSDAVSALMPTPAPGTRKSSVFNKMRLWLPYSEDCKLISWD